MPKFKEKCPEFGQKIRVHGDLGFFASKDKKYFLVQFEDIGRFVNDNDEWIPASEEPQWTQITEDESTWPMLGQHFLLGNQSDLPSVQFYRSIDGIFYDETIFQSPKIKVCELIGRMWLPLPVPPKRKKEEKPYMSDESIEQLKRAETEARLLKLEIDVKFLKEKSYPRKFRFDNIVGAGMSTCIKCGDEKLLLSIIDGVCHCCRLSELSGINSVSRGPVSPWKSTKIEPLDGQLILMKTNDGHVSFPQRYKISKDLYYPQVCHEAFINYKKWMEIPE